MKEFVRALTTEFLKEAKSSPRMFEDLASMEHYMAESYDGRAFVEILQNADDANASSITAFTCGSDFIIANNGRPFDQNDLIAICRSGSSSKKRGAGIGYRGIGFKSATSISTEIIIYSSGAYFTFSKSRCAKEMNQSVDRVPTVRIPFLVEDRYVGKELKQAIELYEKKGFSTFFVFKDGNRDKLITELRDISSGWLLFLNHVECVNIDLPQISKRIEVKRSEVKSSQYLFVDKGNNQSWLIVYGENKTAIAFKYDHHIIPCSSDESLFHCYLPTLDSLGFPFKANADFSTDPSRKHIIINDDESKRSLDSIARLVVDLLSDASFNDQPYLVDIIASRSGISEAASFLDRTVIDYLKKARWIPLQDGSCATPEEHRIAPAWFDAESRKKVFSLVFGLGKDELKTEVAHIAHNFDDLLLRCGCQPYGATEFGTILRSIDAVAALKDSFLGKLWGYTLRGVFFAPASISSYFLKDKNERLVTADAQAPVDFSADFCLGLKGVLNAEEVVRVAEIPAFKRIDGNNVQGKQAAEQKKAVQKKVEYSKWKTPIQNCIVSEQLNGRTPKDVSKKGLGYDIESVDLSGCVHYITVKPVEALGNSFVLSEKEYACAERLGATYRIFIIEQGLPENNMMIEAPLSIPFEKRVREWEWVSGAYKVEKQSKPSTATTIDSRFIQEFSLNNLNHIQIAFLKTLCDGKDIKAFESEFSCRASSLITQINGIVDFYLGDTLIDDAKTIKEQYIGALRYLIEQREAE